MQKTDSISISSHIFMLLGHETWNGTYNKKLGNWRWSCLTFKLFKVLSALWMPFWDVTTHLAVNDTLFSANVLSIEERCLPLHTFMWVIHMILQKIFMKHLHEKRLLESVFNSSMYFKNFRILQGGKGSKKTNIGKSSAVKCGSCKFYYLNAERSFPLCLLHRL